MRIPTDEFTDLFLASKDTDERGHHDDNDGHDVCMSCMSSMTLHSEKVILR